MRTFVTSSVVFVLIIAVFFYFGFVWQWELLHTPDDATASADALTQAAQHGDSFGFVNALFSALAFGGVIVALIMQSQERRDAIKFHRELANQQFLSSLASP